MYHQIKLLKKNRKLMKQIKRISVLISLVSLCACSFFKEIETNAFKENEIPKQYTIDVNKKKTTLFLGIAAFGDSELNNLIYQAIQNNLTLESTRIQYMQAKAQVSIVGAAQYPHLNATFDPSMSKNKSMDTGTHSWKNNFSLGMMSSFEIDFWGKLRAQKKSAQFELTAAELDYQTAMISLISETAICWLEILSQRMQQELRQKQLATNRMYLKLIRLRFQKGMVGSLDVYQQQQVVASILSQLPMIEAQTRLLYNQMNLLCGSPPQKHFTVTRKEFPSLKRLPSAGVPSDLLTNRPDIRASWNRLQASYQNVWVSKARQLPSLNLSASGNFESEKIANLFDAWFVRLASQLTSPIFDAGRLRAETKAIRAKAYAQMLQYRKTVFNAIKEVEDAFVQTHQQKKHIEALKKEQGIVQKALEEARNRYQKGLSDYLPVLTHTLTVQRLDREMIQERAKYYQYHIYLYRALGGQLPKSMYMPKTGESDE
jgi:NodT family efflux transporter outer membrane factor (OMF) lipoprotein